MIRISQSLDGENNINIIIIINDNNDNNNENNNNDNNNVSDKAFYSEACS